MTNSSTLSVHRLTDGWTFKQADDDAHDAWMSVKSVPTNVHLDLIDHGKYALVLLTSPCGQVLISPHQNTRPLPGLQ
jgi:hypothetical protein